MHLHHLNALRLGFSTKQATAIQSLGLDKYLQQQLEAKVFVKEPLFIANSPKSLAEFRSMREAVKGNEEEIQKIVQYINQTNFQFKAWLLQRFNESEYPLREKIALFFQNHFVVTLQSVRVPYWVYLHYQTIHQHALGNYKTLVKEMVYSNALIKYLDNQQNVKNKINENLGRELLELFTLGEGHYTEQDIKNVARALAGLSFGKEKGMYRPLLKDNAAKTIFGSTGNFDASDAIDLIFEKPQVAYFLAEKVLKWFFFDQPPKHLIEKYGKVLLQHQYELKPFFQKMFTEECQHTQGGNQIKNPLVFFLQVHHDLNITPNYKLLAFILKNQAMDIYDQPNVKGWKGGKEWLTSQTYADRNQFIDFLIDGNEMFKKQLAKRLERFEVGTIDLLPKLVCKNNKNAATILEELTNRMIFETNPEMVSDLNQILKYDFDPKSANAQQSMLRVYQYLAKSPEFQII